MTRSATEPRIRIDVLVDEDDRRAELYDATFWGLRGEPKELPTVWLYDEVGSNLFEDITRLPEYYLTRREREILEWHSVEIAERSGASTLVELGAGTSAKTLLLLDALDAAGALERFVPLDVSEEVLRTNAEHIATRYRNIAVHGIVGDFERHLTALPNGDGRLIAFLGSTIGNLDPARRARFYRAVATALAPGDTFLLGVDLVKDPARLEAAYNDSRGVTERFVRNALTVVNRRLAATFDQELFAFSSRWDAECEWMDIGFRALAPQVVRVRELEIDVGFDAAEPLRIEVSAKFRREALEAELGEAGLRSFAWWTDERADFALLLATTS